MKDTFLQRVIEEKNELEQKIEKLNEFFATDIYENLPNEEKRSLVRQVQYMGGYYKELLTRISMNEQNCEFACGDIGNYYGGLNVKREKDKCYWSIENYNGDEWQEIPKSLFDELAKFEGLVTLLNGGAL